MRPRVAKPCPSTAAYPLLLLAGACDPVTPPADARSASSYLPNGHLFVFPAIGHQLTANTISTCPQDGRSAVS
ncbi:MAG: alpha/beta fold hydrolase [Bryobacteraceae bacterium]